MKRLTIALFAGTFALSLYVSAADATETPHHVWSETVLYAFCSQPKCSDGATPYGGLVEDRQGNLYGTTFYGGDRDACDTGCGTVFKIASDGTETVLHAFTGNADGQWPIGSLIIDKAGNLYGATQNGGTSDSGTVFRIAPDGTSTILHAFAGGSDGAFPEVGVIEDAAGNFYGTTAMGGTYSGGTVFKIAADGSESVLHSFGGGGDGVGPSGSLMEDLSGNLYGTTYEGGGTTCDCGTVFKIKPDGGEVVLHVFDGDGGSYPEGSLIQDTNGNFYGTTRFGAGSGCNSLGCGTAFKLKPDGTLKVLYSFGGSSGSEPTAGLLLDNAGGLNGTTLSGGPYNAGTAFRLRPDGKEINLYAFCSPKKAGCGDGASPLDSGLIKSRSAIRAGVRYGTTYSGGKIYGCQGGGCGVVFKLSR